LRAENYANGDQILSNLSADEWFTTEVGATAVYGEGDSDCVSFSPIGDACQQEWALLQFGRLYNSFSVIDDRALCPSDWHISSNEDWIVLEEAFGGPQQAGDYLKASIGWELGGNGSLISGYNGMPGGARANVGNYIQAGSVGYWWSPGSSWTIARSLQHNADNVSTGGYGGRSGFSVRCVKDAE
jgi:uncharacterized protein (TIGR02145 family)